MSGWMVTKAFCRMAQSCLLRGAALSRTGRCCCSRWRASGPGEIIRLNGTGPHRVRISVRVISHVAPVQIVQIIAGGKIVAEQKVQADAQQGRWIEIERTIELDRVVMDCREGAWGGSLGRAGRRSAHQSCVRRHR